MIEVHYIEQIGKELGLAVPHVEAALSLLESGATIPFVARYRRDATGGLDEEQLEHLQERANYFAGIAARRSIILASIAEQGTLTDVLLERIERCMDKFEIEDLYLPFKNRRRTKATMAEDQGLGPLADFLMRQLPVNTIEEFAESFVKPERSISSVEEALDGAGFILVEFFAHDAAVRAAVREAMLTHGRLTARSTKNAEGKKTRYESFYNFSESMAKLSPQRTLAILRGAKEGFLRVDIVLDDEQIEAGLLARFLKEPGSIFEPHLRRALHEAYTRHGQPAVEKEVMELVRERADKESVRQLRQNAANLLMAPAAGSIRVVGLVLSEGTTWSAAVLDESGGLLEHATFALDGGPENATESALAALMQKHETYAVVFGNGKGSRRAAQWVSQVLSKVGKPEAFGVPADTALNALFSGSRYGRDEFPGLDPPIREAIAVGRRLQDPLAELVKVEPRSLATGPYQYDANQKHLREGLTRTVVSCVNHVGVELNRASASLLRYVSGMQMGTAQSVLESRNQRGRFCDRRQLLDVEGVGPRVFEQCAGFVRLQGGDSPLDATCIHPEAYPLVEQIAERAGVAVADLPGNADALNKVDFDALEGPNVGPHLLRLIRAELLNPGCDPRPAFKAPPFVRGAWTLAELQEDAEVSGVVTNVTDFGAFVDIGVQQDGLVHLSELSTSFVKDPREVVKSGDIVRVKVLKVDRENPRISLSMKALMPPPPPKRHVARRPETDAGVAPEADHAPPPSRGPEQGPGERTRPPSPERRGQERERGREQPERERARRPAGARPERRDRGEQRGRDRSPDRRPERSTVKSGSGMGPVKTSTYGGESGPLNTVLAEQLAALREKFRTG